MMKLATDFVEWLTSGSTLAPASKIVGFFSPLLGAVVFAAYLLLSDPERGPCTPEGYPGRCYFVSEHLCKVTWDKFGATCKDMIAKLNLPSGRLTGPIMFNCQAMNFDGVLTAS